MKFYKRFPGDITIKTGDLSLAEFGAYDRLLDHYYAKEQPIDPERVYTVARCQSASDRRAVDRVLAEYWKLTEAGWVQERADEMIAEALPRIEAAKANGAKGGRPKGSKKKPTGLPGGTDPVLDQEASQSQNQNSEANASGVPPVDNSEALADARRKLWVDAGNWLVANGMNVGEAKEFINTLAKEYPGVVAEVLREAMKEKAPALVRPFTLGVAKKLDAARRAEGKTVPSDAALRTAAYLAEQSANAAAATPPPAYIVELTQQLRAKGATA